MVWSDYTGLLIFPMYEDNTLLGYIGRRFNGEGSKYIIRGEKNSFNTVYGSGGTLVFTEDLISAVKVGRVTSAKPLFGTHVRTIPDGYKSYRIWLDKDKQVSAVQQASKWKQYGYDVTTIITPLDPKCYDESFIKEQLQ